MDEAAQFSGFDPEGIDGVEVLAADEVRGIDTLVRIAFRGDAEAIDRLTDAASFEAPIEPGIRVFETPLDDVELPSLEEPASGEDRYEDVQGRTVIRKVVRGRDAEGLDVLHVWAFTT